MSASPVDTDRLPVSWRAVLKTTIRVLTFRASRDELTGLGYKHLALGVVFAWLVGMGRYWDNPRVGLPQHLGVGSVIYVFVLALFLWLIVWPLRPKNWSYLRVVAFVSLVSPPAILYALPVEKFYSMQTAGTINVWFLFIVATWRVALLVFFLRRLGELDWIATVIATLLPLTIIVVSLTVLNLERVVFDMMGGVNYETAEDNPFTFLLALSMLSVLLFFPLVLSYVALIVAARIATRRKRLKKIYE